MAIEMEIFRAWLRKTVKIDKNPNGREIQRLTDVKAAKITQYHSGRVDNNVRTWPNIPLEDRKKILNAANTSYDAMLSAGQQALDDGIFDSCDVFPPGYSNSKSKQTAKPIQSHEDTITLKNELQSIKEKFELQEAIVESQKALIELQSRTLEMHQKRIQELEKINTALEVEIEKTGSSDPFIQAVHDAIKKTGVSINDDQIKILADYERKKTAQNIMEGVKEFERRTDTEKQ